MLKIRTAFLALGLVSTSALAKVEVIRDDDATVWRFEVEGLDFAPLDVDGVGLVQASLKGVEGYDGVIYAEGEPAIPALRFVVDGEGEIEVKAGAAPERFFRSERRVVPNLRSVPKIAGAKPVLRMNERAYESDEFLPASDFTVETLGTVGGVTRRLVTLHPARYQAAQNRWLLTPVFTVTAKVAAATPPSLAAGETLAFVVGEAFAGNKALADYKALKESLGYRVETIAVSGTRSTPQAIRDELRALYARRDVAPLKYALIIGDNADVPGYPSSIIYGVTDHYYRSLDNPDYDRDIGTPDIAVGRLAVSTEAELESVLAKLTKYERGAFKDQSWLNALEWIATDDYNYWQVAEGSFDYAIDRYTIPQGYTGTFPNATQAGGDKLYAITHEATSAQVVERMRAGRGFINYGGHGSTDSWAGPGVTAADVQSMDHPEAIPVVLSNACITGQFVTDSFAETWLKHPQGAAMFWGSMDSTYWDEDDVLQRAVYDAIFRDAKLGFSAFTGYGLEQVWRHYGGAGLSKYYWETYVVFGDPTMQLRSRPAVTPDVATRYDAAAGQIVVSVHSGGKPIAGARIAVALPEGIAIILTGPSGEASLAAPAAAFAAAKLTVSGPNLRLVELNPSTFH